MGARSLSKFVTAVFLLLGVSCVWLRHQSRHAAYEAIETSRWRLTYDVAFTADAADAEVRIAIPSSTANAEIRTPEITYPDLQARVLNFKKFDYRAIAAVARQPGPYRVTAGFEILLDPTDKAPVLDRLTELTLDQRQRFLQADEQLPTGNADVNRILQDARGNYSTDEELLHWIFDYCAQHVRRADGQSATSNVANIVSANPSAATPLGRARLMTTLCRRAGIPARLVAGFELRQQDQVVPHIWLEAFRNSRWTPFDPANGYAWHMPPDFIPARRGGEAIVYETRDSQVSGLAPQFSLVRLPPPESVLRAAVPHPVQILDLTRLPVEMHRVMSLLLLLPLGALITAVFRNVIGIRTFGTFAPALLALSFIYADWDTGLVILTVVIVVGLVGRRLLERLHLLMVPRLSIILTIIILCVLFSVSALEYLQLTFSADAVLLPLVILTTLIERFFVSTEEDGVSFSLQLVVGTLVVAAFCYVLLRWDEVGQLMLIYPEAHFITIAVFIMIGRYSGYRITELWRFRDLVSEDGAAVEGLVAEGVPLTDTGKAITRQADQRPPEPGA